MNSDPLIKETAVLIYACAFFFIIFSLFVDIIPKRYDHPTQHEYRMGVQLCRISNACHFSATE